MEAASASDRVYEFISSLPSRSLAIRVHSHLMSGGTENTLMQWKDSFHSRLERQPFALLLACTRQITQSSAGSETQLRLFAATSFEGYR